MPDQHPIANRWKCGGATLQAARSHYDDRTIVHLVDPTLFRVARKLELDAGSTALTPATGGSAHKRASLAIVQEGPHGLADRHAGRFLVRVHQLRGNHLRVLGHHRAASPTCYEASAKHSARTRPRYLRSPPRAPNTCLRGEHSPLNSPRLATVRIPRSFALSLYR